MQKRRKKINKDGFNNNDIYKNFRNSLMPIFVLQDFAKDMSKKLEVVKMAFSGFESHLDNIYSTFQIIKDNIPRPQELQKFADEVVEAIKYKKTKRDVMLKSGWWLTPSIMKIPFFQLREAIEKYENGKSGALTQLFFSVYQTKDCEYLSQVVKRWQKSKYFKPWDKHLKQALFAHKNKQYYLSVPALLIVAEGITKEYCKDKKITFNSTKGNENIKNTLEDTRSTDKRIKQNLEMLEIDLFFIVIDEKMYKDTRALKNKRGFRYVLNRHAVLHGESINYGTPKNSLQGFMLLDVLSLLK